MAHTDPLSDDFLVRLLREHIRSTLRAALMEAAEREVDEAVNQAVIALEVHIQKYRDQQLGAETVRVFVERPQ